MGSHDDRLCGRPAGWPKYWIGKVDRKIGTETENWIEKLNRKHKNWIETLAREIEHNTGVKKHGSLIWEIS